MERKDSMWKDEVTPLGNHELDHDGDNLNFRTNPVVATTEVVKTTRARRWWIALTWLFTWWIPSFLLIHIGKMKRADIRQAWREKVAIFLMIFTLCGIVIFYIIIFGRLLCPNSAKAWNTSELATHQGEDDYYAAIRGKVYDFTTFYKGQHSDIQAYPTSSDIMLQFAGQDLTNYFPQPMVSACPGLVTNDQLSLMYANFTPQVAYAVHTSGALQSTPGTKLNNANWYKDDLQAALLPRLKGDYVYTKAQVSDLADNSGKQWAIYKNKVYDLSDYLYTVQYYSSSSGTDLPNYSFLNDDITGLFQQSAGQDITKQMDTALAKLSSEDAASQLTCLDNAFYVGETDFRLTARCTVQNWLLLAFSIILMTTILSKFLAALQLGSKRHPEAFDKFVICQVPCYTEGEESLKRTINSLSSLNYDDKRRLIFIICDGNITGKDNDRSTPQIALDILGVNPKTQPEPLMFKSIGDGSKQLNYGKVYSGLYEHEGHVVPYVVVVKVGKPSEDGSKAGNRGKRDSQVLLLQFLNRVHFDAAMSPLELEIYHQMRNVIGIDPAFYEYIFQVDADTTVTPESLNRMISCTADDSKIIGICGETKLENERESLTTMIQVYEYYISHHLTKAFESLFGSVTCLPGCFSVYRIRTADQGRPVIISSLVIEQYAEPNIDTLHKKNLFSLGEDRYLTTLMMKYFPQYKMKFTPDAIAHTVAPSSWSVLLSQRRRWINSTVHNLVELLFLPEMCGFCCFSMRWIVFVDLLGTLVSLPETAVGQADLQILPATCAYLVYLIVVVSTGKAAVPVISLAMIGAVYGLQALIFILKREFMLIGWMFLYILAFPVYSVFLPIYSFWSMDDFSWGSTRKVIGEGNNKTIVYEDEMIFDDSMIPMKSFKDYEANAWERASIHESEATIPTSYSHPRSIYNQQRPISSRPGSIHSSIAEVPGADYYRDASPLGLSHSSRNLREHASRQSLRQSISSPYLGAPQGQPRPGMPDPRQSMAGLSMWGGGSQYGPPGPGSEMYQMHPQMQMQMHPQQHQMQMMSPGYFNPHAPFHPQQPGMNPFDSPQSERGHSFYPPQQQPHHPGMGAPRNTVMSNLAGMAGPTGGGMHNPRMSTFSLATTANPLQASAPLEPNDDPAPEDGEVLSVLRRYLAQQDLMSVTKRQTREALNNLFPKANLQERTGWVNENIDKVLAES